jgi:hypothetical protein
VTYSLRTLVRGRANRKVVVRFKRVIHRSTPTTWESFLEPRLRPPKSLNILITTQRVLHHHNTTMAGPPPNFQALGQALGNIAASVNASVNTLQNLQTDLGTVQQELGRLANQPTNQNLQNQLSKRLIIFGLNSGQGKGLSCLSLTNTDQQANDTGRDINNDAKIKTHGVTNKNRCLGAISASYHWSRLWPMACSSPNPQSNWANWQAWDFPPDMAAVYAIQRSKKYDIQ